MLQVSISRSLEAYMRLFHGQVTRHYVQSSQTFRHNPLSTPSLLLYSLADVVGRPRPIESLISEWRAGGVTVYTHCWTNTPHVRHYLHDPLTYTAALNHFLDTIALGHHDEHSVAITASKL